MPAHHPQPLQPVATADRNRSLERGINILRSFKPGSDLLGNGEIAERTGLSRATVSRLTQTLVDSGMLEHDRRQRAYRLAAPVLSLAHAMRSGSTVLQITGPLMRQEAEQRKINVGLAVADRDDMVYLESVRYSKRVPWRNVVEGQRVPMELTSLGRAWLATADVATRNALMAVFRARRTHGWQSLVKDINAAMASVHAHGYCWASWQPQVVALATPIVIPGRATHVLNMSVSTEADPLATVQRLSGPLLALAEKIQRQLAKQQD